MSFVNTFINLTNTFLKYPTDNERFTSNLFNVGEFKTLSLLVFFKSHKANKKTTRYEYK